MAEEIAGTVMVIAKTPEPGRSKTRLCPPLTVDEACAVAWACLRDTLAVVADVPVRRRVVVLDGESGPWVPDGFDVVVQRGAGLDDRLAAAFADVDDDAVVIAMDTPQVTPQLLVEALTAVVDRRDTASFGPAEDGGFWLLGLPRGVDPRHVFDRIPMSVAHTGSCQLDRLMSLGLAIHTLPVLRDVDTFEDLCAVASELPGSMTAGVVGRLAASIGTRAARRPG